LRSFRQKRPVPKALPKSTNIRPRNKLPSVARGNGKLATPRRDGTLIFASDPIASGRQMPCNFNTRFSLAAKNGGTVQFPIGLPQR